MLRPLQPSGGDPGGLPPADHWLPAFWADFRRRFLALLGYQFRVFPTALSLSVLSNPAQKQQSTGPSRRGRGYGGRAAGSRRGAVVRWCGW